VPPGGRRPSLQGRIHGVSPQAYSGTNRLNSDFTNENVNNLLCLCISQCVILPLVYPGGRRERSPRFLDTLLFFTGLLSNDVGRVPGGA
jgi:hypothetical protein